MRRRKTIADDRLEFTLLGGDHCMWTEIHEASIARVPLALADGRQVQPGDRCTRLGGKRTSAGYTTVRMLDGEYLTYLGQFSNLDGILVLFDTREPKSHLVAYWLHEKGTRTLFHFTPACSGRAVELTAWEFSCSREVAA